ncbi:MAG: hypothetical protein K8S98_02355 [Planctomycetes bacterium]|nr:hypothetical protein [Planctomycetota bacterium]
MTAPHQATRSRAGGFLLLYLLSAGAASAAIADMEVLAEKLGALCVPLGLLCAGCWYAYKDGGRAVRTIAAALVLITISSFGLGLIHGYRSHQAGREIDAELQQLRAGVLADSADTDPESGSTQRLLDRTQDAALRMQASKNEQTAALGRAMQSISSLTRASDQRLGAAMDAVRAEDFLNAVTLLETHDFESQRTTANEYLAAAQATCEVYEHLPEAAERKLSESDMTPDGASHLLIGMRRSLPYSMKVFQAHVRTAKTYIAIIDFIESNAAALHLNAESEIEFDADETRSTYIALNEAIGTSVDGLNAAIDAFTAFLGKQP